MGSSQSLCPTPTCQPRPISARASSSHPWPERSLPQCIRRLMGSGVGSLKPSPAMNLCEKVEVASVNVVGSCSQT